MGIDELTNISDIKDLPSDMTVECPFCPPSYHDGKKKLSINFEKNVYHCWRCNSSGKADQLLKNFSSINKNDIIDYSFDTKNFNFKQDDEKNNKSELSRDLFAYDSFAVKILENNLYNAKLYLNDRGLSDQEIEYYDIRVGRYGYLYKNRVIIPTFDDYKNVVYFVARDYVNPNNKLRYLNSPGSNKSFHVWNLNNVKENDTIIITEGCFSGISANRIENMTAVSTYGKFMSEQQAKMIASKNPKEIIFSLDGDVPKNELQKNILLIKLFYRGSISYIDIPNNKDPNDLSFEEYKYLINHRKEVYSGTQFL